MSNRKKKPKRAGKGDVAQVILIGTEGVVPWKETPQRPRAAKAIHPRRPAPPVPRGKEVTDGDPSPPVDIEESSD